MTENTPVSQESKGNVIFVDDDKFLADMYGMKFTSAGYTVHSCLSIVDALAVLKQGFKPDAIVFDLLMPEMDGYNFLQTLTREHLAESAALIALTNQGNDNDKSNAEQLGVHRYIVKASMIPSEVVTTVGEEIAKRKRYQVQGGR